MSEDRTETWRWPDFAPHITFLAASCFVASLLYVHGLGDGMQQNLLGFFDLSDFLRITPAWGIPSIGLYLLSYLREYLRTAHHKEDATTSVTESKAKPSKILLWLQDLDRGGLFWLVLLVTCGALVLGPFVRHKWWVGAVSSILYVYFVWRLVYWFVVRFRRAHPQDSFIYGVVPVQLALPLAVTLVLAYNWGRYMVPYNIEKTPAAKIILKDEKAIVEGKVFLELNRFIIFVTSDGRITAVAVSDVNSIEFPKSGVVHRKDKTH
jgi:hypothetical protein